ncbi:MAG: hypothetical protein F6K23_39375, partial [Okeania sp. SIO2C9]|uniref:phage integrase N-terminal SAM-like domain-containing protein n=1 Tax=Okeania sp. SIO2C9 TaxID=2607791 RepID=UPI0013C09A2E
MAWEPWRVLQAIDALRRFGLATRCPWHSDIDWNQCIRQADSRSMNDGEIQQVLDHGRLPDDPELQRFAVEMRSQRYSLRTEKSYLHWLKRCLNYHHLRSASSLSTSHAAPFLEHLAAE